MYLVICDQVPYFIQKDCDTIRDFIGMAEDVYVCKSETAAIRKHLLTAVGIMED